MIRSGSQTDRPANAADDLSGHDLGAGAIERGTSRQGRDPRVAGRYA
jgi:hypothetical protein